MTIQIENSCQGELQKQNGSYITTKRDKKNHGIGLKSVKRIIDKYRGEMVIQEQEGSFLVKIMLYV